MSSCGHIEVSGIILGFPRLSPRGGQVAHVLLSRSPLYTHLKGALTVRLACVRRAASVHPEPGSNSPFGAPRRARRMVSKWTSGPRSKTTPISDFTGIDSAPCPRARHSSIASLSFVVRSLGHGIRFSGCPAASVRVGRAPREEVIYAPYTRLGSLVCFLHVSYISGL